MSLDPIDNSPIANWPRPLGFVFSGGGAYGATQVGMIRALVQAGILPDLVVGTSVGALNGAMFAAEPMLSVDRLTKIWSSMSRSGVFGGKSRIATALSILRYGMLRNSPGLVSPEALRNLIESQLPVQRLEDLHIPTAIVATDALVGQAKLLTRGELAPALQASAAIPGVFPPVKIDGCFYIDGGVSANVPIRQAIKFGARSLIVLDANPASMPGTLPSSTIGSVLHASMIMLRNQRADLVDDLVGKYPILHLPRVTPATQSSFEFDNSAALIEAGFAHSRAFLHRLPELVAGSPPLDGAGISDTDPGGNADQPPTKASPAVPHSAFPAPQSDSKI